MLRTVGWDDGERVRSIMYRGAVSEMIVPYGDPALIHARKNVFDIGELNFGALANSLTLGLRLPRRDLLLRCRAGRRARQSVHARERNLHARRRLRRALAPPQLAHRQDRGAPFAPAGHLVVLDHWELRLRLLLVLLPGWQHRVRGQANRHSLDRSRDARREANPWPAPQCRWALRSDPPARFQLPPRPGYRRRR